MFYSLNRIGSVLLGIFILLALFAQSLIPTGYMPSLTSRGHFFEIVICHGNDESIVTVDEHMNVVSTTVKDKSQNAPETKKEPCVFAQIALKNFALSYFQYVHPSFLSYERVELHQDAQLAVSFSANYYQSQAPPLFHS